MKRFLALVLLACTSVVVAAEYPTKPIRIVTPFPPGGSVDLVARTLAADLVKPLGQQVVVDNPQRRVRKHRHRACEERAAGWLYAPR